VDTAPDGAAALSKVNEEPPDAILLDVMMPGMNGRQFLDELRKLRDKSDIPVVVMTALHGLANKPIEYGANDVVEKPFDIDELLNIVALALFRSGEYDTLDEPRAVAVTEPADGSPAPTAVQSSEISRVLMVVDEDKRSLAELDAELGAEGYTVVSLSRATDELRRLATALEPHAIVLALRGADPMAIRALRTLRADARLAAVPILVFSRDPAELEARREEISELSGHTVSSPAAIYDLLG